MSIRVRNVAPLIVVKACLAFARLKHCPKSRRPKVHRDREVLHASRAMVTFMLVLR